MASKPRSEKSAEDSPSEPDLLLLLDDLRLKLIDKDGYSDMVEKYKYFCTHSEYGKNCSYARKCKDIFLRYNYDDIKSLFLQILDQFRLIEGKEFGNGEKTP